LKGCADIEALLVVEVLEFDGGVGPLPSIPEIKPSTRDNDNEDLFFAASVA
jgi:hypothetical protein